MKKISTLFVVNDFEDISLNKSVLNLCRGLSRNEFWSTVISLSDHGQLLAEFRSIPFVTVYPSSNIFIGMIRIIRFLRFRHSITIIQTQTLRADYVVFISRLLLLLHHRRIIHLCVRRNYFFLDKNLWHKLKNISYLVSCHLARLNVCVAYHLEQKLINNLLVNPAKVTTIVNGVRTNYVRSNNVLTSKSKLGLENSPALVFSGRLIRRKNVELLIESLAKVRFPCQCVIIGGGDEKTRLERLCAKYNVKNSVKFVGHIKNVGGYLATADIFVMPSIDEGLSWSVLEAMSHGLACVVSDADGNVELIKHGVNGLVFKINDGTEGLAKCLRQLIADPQLRRRLSTNARKTVKENYTESAMISSYQKLYLRLTNFDTTTSAVTPVR